MPDRTLSPIDALKSEFQTHYLADELDGDWLKGLARTAWGSAVRLKQNVGDDQVKDLIGLLQAARNDADHPIVQMICDETWIDWTGDPKEWHELQQLLDAIALNLEDRDIYSRVP